MSLLPKHVQSGQKLGLEIGPRGECSINLIILNEGENLSEEVKFLIDTGFNGHLQLNESIVSRLNLKVINKNTTTGFDGEIKEVGIVKTKIKLLDQEIWNFPIQVTNKGLCLIGTNLLKDLGKMIIVDFKNGIITLTDDKKVQKKVHKAVNKYA
ncbi:MAG: hypothetical protein Q7R49_00635 [Candidatus Daviesbacteria bacterium]|nr:hypothetical protein [Candidatus Daviesbacteria bacterium]